MERELQRIEQLIGKGQAVLATHRQNPPNVIGFPTLDKRAFSEWRTQSLVCLVDLLGSGHVYANDFEKIGDKGYLSAAEKGLGILQALREDIASKHLANDEGAEGPAAPMALLEQLAERFHLVARQLRSRYDGRETISVQDEYDVQDLLHALLWIHFQDIRPEEWTPSYAGKTSRADFLLKAEQIVVEVKKTRPGLGAKEVGTQLIEDIERYQKHPDCRALVCFVYDPEGLVANPRGLENDLTRETPIPVRVYVRPR